MSDPELHREANDLWFGAGDQVVDADPEDEEGGRYAVRIVHLDGVERIDSTWKTPARADKVADRARDNLAAAGYDHRRVHVDVVDLDDPEHRIEEED